MSDPSNSGTDGPDGRDPPEGSNEADPGAGGDPLDGSEGFTVAVKASARRANDAVADLARERGDRPAFATESAAVAAAERLSERGEGRVRIQRPAPSDPAGVDAYLVADPERRTRDPDGSVESGLTYDVTGNQYGALGEALILAHPVNPPGITRYARRDLGLERDAPDGARGEGGAADSLRVKLDDDPEPVTFVDGSGVRSTWVPDCRATARVGPDGRTVGEYLCEVKTGDASFGRSQREVMGRKARTSTVLAVRVDVGDLPGSYSVRIREQAPSDPGDGELLDDSTRASKLDEFP